MKATTAAMEATAATMDATAATNGDDAAKDLFLVAAEGASDGGCYNGQSPHLNSAPLWNAGVVG